jgi:hypothetical protein
MESFLRGRAAAQAEVEQEQQREERTMRQLVLKHEIDRLKLHDKLEEFQLKTAASGAQFDAMQGQPASKFATTIPQAPSGSLAPGVGMPNAASPEVVPTGPKPVTFPGLPSEVGGGSPSYTRTPQTLQEIVQAQIASELAKPYTLNPGDTRYVGGEVVGRGGPKLMGVPVGGLADEGTGKIVVPGPGRPKRGQSIAGTLNGKGAFAVFDPDTEKYTIGGVDVTGKFQPRPLASGTGQADKDRAFLFRKYTADVAAKTRQHAEAMRLYLKKLETAYGGKDEAGNPIGDPPEYVPQTFDEYEAEQPPTGTAPTAKGATTSVKQPADPLTAIDPATGTTYRFPTKEAAAAYKREKGIK